MEWKERRLSENFRARINWIISKGEPPFYLPHLPYPSYAPSLSLRSRAPIPPPRASRFARDAREVQSTRWPECIWLDDSLLTICVEGISVEKTTLPLNTLLIPIFPSPFLKCSVEWLLIISTLFTFLYGSWSRGRAALLDSLLFVVLMSCNHTWFLRLLSASRHSHPCSLPDVRGVCKFDARCAMRDHAWHTSMHSWPLTLAVPVHHILPSTSYSTTG